MEIVTVATTRNLHSALNPAIKSLNYLNNILAKIEANIAGCEEAIMLNSEGFVAECTQGRQLGFDGKTLIHPGQVEGANAAFAPSEQAVEDARGILQAWEDGAGSGVVTYQGRMVESLHVDTARRTLAVHEAISALA